MSSPENVLILPLPELFRDDVFRIETRRLWLRWPTSSDTARLHEITTSETAARGAGATPHPLLAGDVVERIASACTTNAAGSGLVLALSSKARPGEMIGLVSLDATRTGALSLRFVLDVGYQGNGLMTEAIRGLAHAVFTFGPHRAICGPPGLTNHAARRVLEKSGFRAPTHDATIIAAPRLQLTRAAWLDRPPLRIDGDIGAHLDDSPCACAA